MKGFCNRFSGILIVVMALLLVRGMNMILNGNNTQVLVGALMILAGTSLIKGIKAPDQTETKKAWIISFLGKPTDVVVDSMTLVLDWLPISVIDIIEVEMTLVTHKYKADKQIRCHDGGYLIAEATLSFQPDGKTGTTLFQYVSAGGKENVITQIEGSLTTWLQDFVQQKEWEEPEKPNVPATKHQITADWMENNSLKIGKYIENKLTGASGAHDESGNDLRDDNALADIRNLGIKIVNFVLFITPPDEVIKARNDVAVQKAKQQARLANSAGFNTQIEERAKLYRGKKAKPNKEDQQQILDENLIVDGKLTGVINRGGINVTKT